MGNRISVPNHWRSPNSFDNIQGRRDLAKRLVPKVAVWLLVSGGFGALLQWLRAKKMVGKMFPQSSLIQLQDSGLSIAHATVASVFGLTSLLRSNMSDTPRAFFACSAQDTAGVEWTIAYMLADLVVMTAEGNELSGWGPLAHHIIVAFGFAKGIATGFTTQYHVLFLVNEISTVFLHLVRLLRGASETTQAINAILLWVSFLASRLICNAWIFSNVGWHLSKSRSDRSDESEHLPSRDDRSDESEKIPGRDDSMTLRKLLDDPSIFRELCLQLGLAGAAQVLNLFWFYKLSLMIGRKIPTALKAK